MNGLGIAQFGVSPFIMTLGVQSVGAGIALFLTGGVPIGNLPYAFGDFFGFGSLFGMPVPVLIAVLAIVAMWMLMNRTRIGARLYAVGGNIKAANLSGINTKRTLFLAYVICALLASLAGMLLTARVESGETNLGGTIALESIAACVIAGVSLRGGIGRVESVVLGALLHRPGPERHEPDADRLLHADGPAREPADPRRHHRPVPLPHDGWRALTSAQPKEKPRCRLSLPLIPCSPR